MKAKCEVWYGAWDLDQKKYVCVLPTASSVRKKMWWCDIPARHRIVRVLIRKPANARRRSRR